MMRSLLLAGLTSCAPVPPVLERPDLTPPTDPLCDRQAPPDALGCAVDPEWTYEWPACRTPFTADLYGAPDDRYQVRLEATLPGNPPPPPEILYAGAWEGSRFRWGDLPGVSDDCVGLRLVVSSGTGACGVCTDQHCVPDLYGAPDDLVCPDDAS